jgi:hypothetical protein
MFFDASRLNLIEDNLDRVCLAIDALLAPGEGETGQASWESTRPGRLLITRMIILGVLASVALVPQPAPEDIVDKLREATSSLLAQAQAGVGARP